MKRLSVILIAFVALFMLSCTKNERAKDWGGNATLNLPANQKLVNVTWKDCNLWYLTKPMTVNDVAETYYFTEKSAWGLMKGTYTIVETKNNIR